MTIEEKILKKIVPTIEEEQAINIAIENLCTKIQEKAKACGHVVDVILVGSIAKGTYLRGALDIDLFVLYPPPVPREEMKSLTLKLGKHVLSDWMIQYAEHPYIRGKYGPYDVDIVPCYKVQSTANMQSAVDRTPFHTSFIQERLSNKQRNQVRLLKQFLKGIDCYSAEVRVQGFSGYLAELLVLKYGSFRDTLAAALNWKEKEFIVFEERTGPKKTNEPLVFIDPVDPSRNVAAALSDNKRRLFMQAAKEYIKNPRESFFFPRPIQSWPLKKIASHLKTAIGVELPHPEVIDDIVYSQVRKGQHNLAKLFKKYDFEVLNTSFYVNKKILLAMHLKSLELSDTKIHQGPPIAKKEYVDAFLEKWKKHGQLVGEPFMENNRWCVIIKRRYKSARELLEIEMPGVSLGKHLDQLKDKLTILVGEQLSQPHYAAFWTEFLLDVPPWNR